MPFAFSVLLAFAVPAALVVGLGFILALPLPRRFAALRSWLCPALGLAAVGSIGPVAGALGLTARSITWPLVVLAGVGWVLLIRAGGMGPWLRAHRAALAVGLGALVLAAFPLAFQGTLTTIGTSIDALSYNVRSEFVQDHPLRIPDVPPGQPWLGWVAGQIGFLRVGDVYFLGLTALALSRRSFELFSVIAALAHVHAALGTYFFARAGLRGSRKVGVLAAAFVALSNTLIWPGLDCSLSQALALAFVPVCLAAATVLARRPSPRLAVVLGLLLSGLVAIYPVYAVVVGAAVGLLGVASVVRHPEPQLRAGRVASLLIAASVSVVASPVSTARAAGELGFVGGMLGQRGLSAVGAGNILVYPPLPELFGFVRHAAEAHGIPANGAATAIGAVLAALAAALVIRGLLLLGFVRAIPSIAILLLAGGLAVHQRFLVNPPGGYPYGYYKAVTLLAIALAPALAAGIASGPAARVIRPWGLVAAAAFLLVSAGNTLWTLQYSATTQVLASREVLEAFRNASRIAGGRGIELIVEPGPLENWLGYLLRRERVDFPCGNAIHPAPSASLDGAAFALVDRNRESSADGCFQAERPSRTVWEGPRYKLIEWTDGRLSEWPLTGVDTGKGGAARAEIDRARGEIVVDVGGAQTRRALPSATVRTIQIGISSQAGAVLSSPDGAASIAPGTWLIDWDASCRSPLEVARSPQPVVLESVVLLGRDTGEPGRCTEVLPNPRGYLEWKGTVDGQVFRGEVLVVPPGGGAPSAYRVGIHVGGGSASRSGWWGVFSLDLPRDGRPHRAIVRIDLRDKTGLGWMDGAKAPLEVAALEDVVEGQFGATLALWDIQLAPRQLLTAPVLSFDVASGTSVEHVVASPDMRRWWRAE